MNYDETLVDIITYIKHKPGMFTKFTARRCLKSLALVRA